MCRHFARLLCQWLDVVVGYVTSGEVDEFEACHVMSESEIGRILSLCFLGSACFYACFSLCMVANALIGLCCVWREAVDVFERCFTVPLDDVSLSGDLRLIERVYGKSLESMVEHDVRDVGSIDMIELAASAARSDTESGEKVREYYEQTTDRDYQWLETAMGPGMHTKLGHMTQEMLILNEIREHGDVSDVLEVGCGRGSCSLFLAEALGGKVSFTGVDLVGRHVEVAKAECCLRDLDGIVEFVQGDVCGDWAKWESATAAKKGQKYQVIFGVESLCHMDSKEKVCSFMRQASRRLSTGGRLVIVDGFRCRMWEKAGAEHKMAMRLAESGFKICRMPSKADWIRAGGDEDMTFANSVDLTGDALPYWTFGWRLARFVLYCGEWVRWVLGNWLCVRLLGWVARGASRLWGRVDDAGGGDAFLGLVACVFGSSAAKAVGSSASRKQTAGNVLAAATVAHAMRSGAAEYGVLVLERMKHKEHGEKEKARLRYGQMSLGNKSI